MKCTQKFLIITLLTILLSVTGLTSYAKASDSPNTSSAAQDETNNDPPTIPLDGNEALITGITSPDYPDLLWLDLSIQDLTSGTTYSIDNLVLTKDHIYRFVLIFTSSGEKIENVQLVAQIPEEQSDETNFYLYFTARVSASGQPLLQAKIPATLSDETEAIQLKYLKDSGKTTFCGSLSNMLSYEEENLFDPQSGVYLGDIYSAEACARINGIVPETVVLDFQATGITTIPQITKGIANLASTNSSQTSIPNWLHIIGRISFVVLIYLGIYFIFIRPLEKEVKFLHKEVYKLNHPNENEQKTDTPSRPI